MSPKVFAYLALLIVLLLIFASCRSRAYRSNTWYSPGRSNYGNFRGGGPSWGK